MKKLLAGILSVVASGFVAVIASSVASFSPAFIWDEPNCPESLID